MTDEQRKAGHEAIKLLFRAALHPGQVPQSIIFESQQTLSALLERKVAPDHRSLKERIAARNYNRKLNGEQVPGPCGEIILDEFRMGPQIGFEQKDDQQGTEWARGITSTCIRPSGSWGTVGVPDIAEGVTPTAQDFIGRTYLRPIDRGPATPEDS